MDGGGLQPFWLMHCACAAGCHLSLEPGDHTFCAPSHPSLVGPRRKVMWDRLGSSLSGSGRRSRMAALQQHRLLTARKCLAAVPAWRIPALPGLRISGRGMVANESASSCSFIHLLKTRSFLCSRPDTTTSDLAAGHYGRRSKVRQGSAGGSALCRVSPLL